MEWKGLAAVFRDSQLHSSRAARALERKERKLLWAFAWASGMPSLASEELSAPLADISSEALACGDIPWQALVGPVAVVGFVKAVVEREEANKTWQLFSSMLTQSRAGAERGIEFFDE
jgi:hypothetical protein